MEGSVYIRLCGSCHVGGQNSPLYHMPHDSPTSFDHNLVCIGPKVFNFGIDTWSWCIIS